MELCTARVWVWCVVEVSNVCKDVCERFAQGERLFARDSSSSEKGPSDSGLASDDDAWHSVE